MSHAGTFEETQALVLRALRVSAVALEVLAAEEATQLFDLYRIHSLSQCHSGQGSYMVRPAEEAGVRRLERSGSGLTSLGGRRHGNTRRLIPIISFPPWSFSSPLLVGESVLRAPTSKRLVAATQQRSRLTQLARSSQPV